MTAEPDSTEPAASGLYSRRRPRWMRAIPPALLLVGGVWLVSLVAVVVSQRRNQATHASAIVVLGAAQYSGRPSPVLRARLDHAIALYRAGFAPLLITTGGRGDGDTTSEAAVGRRYAIRAGVPAAAIRAEENGRTTSESLRAVADLMDGQPTNDVILVSDGFHMLRLAVLARRFGLTPHTSPAPTSPIGGGSSIEWRYVLRESVKAPLAFFLERPR